MSTPPPLQPSSTSPHLTQSLLNLLSPSTYPTTLHTTLHHALRTHEIAPSLTPHIASLFTKTYPPCTNHTHEFNSSAFNGDLLLWLILTFGGIEAWNSFVHDVEEECLSLDRGVPPAWFKLPDAEKRILKGAIVEVIQLLDEHSIFNEDGGPLLANEGREDRFRDPDVGGVLAYGVSNFSAVNRDRLTKTTELVRGELVTRYKEMRDWDQAEKEGGERCELLMQEWRGRGEQAEKMRLGRMVRDAKTGGKGTEVKEKGRKNVLDGMKFEEVERSQKKKRDKDMKEEQGNKGISKAKKVWKDKGLALRAFDSNHSYPITTRFVSPAPSSRSPDLSPEIFKLMPHRPPIRPSSSHIPTPFPPPPPSHHPQTQTQSPMTPTYLAGKIEYHTHKMIDELAMVQFLESEIADMPPEGKMKLGPYPEKVTREEYKYDSRWRKEQEEIEERRVANMRPVMRAVPFTVGDLERYPLLRVGEGENGGEGKEGDEGWQSEGEVDLEWTDRGRPRGRGVKPRDVS